MNPNSAPLQNTEAKKEKKSKAAQIAGIASTVLWILGFVLTFTVRAGNPFVWLGDALLLIGFWPLLWVWRPGWPWIIFGLLNMAIGFLLEIAYHLPTDTFTNEMILVRNHLRDHHSVITWILIGAVSTIFGFVRTFKQIYGWLRNRADKRKDTDAVSGS